MEIVLRAIHDQHRKAPKTVSLDMLAQIEIIVDYYEVHETVELIAPT